MELFERLPLILGTARYPSPAILCAAIEASQIEIITVSLRREVEGDGFWSILKNLPVQILPNTAGCRTAVEAITVAEMAREIFDTSWIKVEITGDDYTLQPHPLELIKACEILVARGFTVFPYTTEDLVLAQELCNVGCSILMPWAAPIGSGRGLCNPYGLRCLRERFPDQTLIVDAGLGAPSQAAEVMEMGYDGVLINTAVALADQPAEMAKAFAMAVAGGHKARHAGLMPRRDLASPSTPLIGTPFTGSNLYE